MILKPLEQKDRTQQRELLFEAIPITGSIVSGTYSDLNIKEYAHGVFQSVYDYPYLSSSANHIFDITAGYSVSSSLHSTTNQDNKKKVNIYNQMAQVLTGHDQDGIIGRFDLDGTNPGQGDEANKVNDAYFVNFSRLLTKDEIRKGSFNLTLGVSGSSTFDYPADFSETIKVYDKDGSDNYFSNPQAGDFGILYATTSAGSDYTVDDAKCGLIFYQAGVVVLTGSVFLTTGEGGILTSSGPLPQVSVGPYDVTGSFVSSSINNIADGLRNRIANIQFNNTTELNSSIYYCRVNHNEFNYSSNPTYLDGSKLRVKNQASDTPISYITTVGLYSEDNELLAVAKLSEPIKKTPTNELTIRVRLDY